MKCTTIAALILSLGALTACTAEADSAPPPTPSVTGRGPVPGDTPAPTRETTLPQSPTPSPSPAPSPSPSPSETLDADQLAATQTVNEFFRLVNELSKNPDLPLQPLADITTAQTQGTQVRSVHEYRQENAIQIGDVKHVVLATGPVQEVAGTKLVVVEVCSDASGSDMVDRDTGVSIESADQARTIHWMIDVVTEDGVWKIGDITNKPVERC